MTRLRYVMWQRQPFQILLPFPVLPPVFNTHLVPLQETPPPVAMMVFLQTPCPWLCCSQFQPNSRTLAQPLWRVWSGSCVERQQWLEVSTPSDWFCLSVLRGLLPFKWAFLWRTALCCPGWGVFVFTNPLSSCLGTTQPLGNGQFAQGAISSLVLSKQITCYRFRPETEPLSMRAQWAPSAVVSAAPTPASRLKSHRDAPSALAGVLCALALASPTCIWHFFV